MEKHIMAGKNQLTTTGKKQFVDVVTLINNPKDKAKLQNYIAEIIKCKTRILDENESIKGIREAAVDELGIQPKMLNSLIAVYFNNNFEEKLEELERFENALTALMQNGGPAGEE